MRLIDADVLISELKESALHHCNNPREDSLLQRDRVIVRAQPTIEAIPKDQYETRLKADLEAIFVGLQMEIGECVDGAEGSPQFEQGVTNARVQVVEIIQQKINALKENTDGSN